MTMYDDGTYLSFHPTWDEEHSAWKADQVANIIAKNGVEFSSYVDVGCGAGGVIRMLSGRYPQAQFSGYDVSSQAIEMAEKHESPNVRFFRGDAFSESDSQFDMASAIDVFEHVDDYIGFVRKMRLLARRCIFHIPLDISVQSILRDLPMNNRRTAGHLHYFMKETALATLQHAGFEILDWVYTPGGVALAKSWKGWLASLPRRLFFRVSPDACVKILGGFSLLVLADSNRGPGS